jgi:hypothetical protein
MKPTYNVHGEGIFTVKKGSSFNYRMFCSKRRAIKFAQKMLKTFDKVKIVHSKRGADGLHRTQEIIRKEAGDGE